MEKQQRTVDIKLADMEAATKIHEETINERERQHDVIIAQKKVHLEVLESEVRGILDDTNDQVMSKKAELESLQEEQRDQIEALKRKHEGEGTSLPCD